ncbi:HAD family hydrolase [Fusibacter sp. 3D3]|uniref:HAD family hydrolase n=1 Tax=Fusibacter sp. 3D3 TaxID=1048380 RepID=UPI0008535947|nr:HAD-IA family hydrolase [Fusibacter sp. 3D3]GAU76807.1 phosphoglycolate phosphatase [Fusibacter sp. 3D3]
MNAVIFDFDGTIINTNELIKEGLNNFAQRYRGYKLVAEEHRALIGKTLEDQMAYINPHKWQLMSNHFKIWYTHHHNAKTCAFPGMIRLIKSLYEQGVRLAIVSNNSTASLDMGLKHLGIETYFEYVITRDDVEETKPSPEGIQKVMELMNLENHEVIYIGDTASDIYAAKNAEIPNAIVGWSNIGDEAIMMLQPDYVLKSPSHLHDIIKEHKCQVA